MILPLASILQPLEDLANWIITFCHDNVGLSWGIAIIAMTFIVRLALLPLSLRGIRSMRRMQVVAPKLQELKERFGREGRVSHLDGVSVEAEDWHFNVRPSNTEPLLRLNLEARSRELMERKRDEVLAVIQT